MRQPPLASGSPGPGRKLYLYAALLLVVIGVPSLLAFLQGFDGITNGLTRVVVPGQTELELESGTWTVFYEHAGEHEGTTYNTSTVSPEMTVYLFGGQRQIPVVHSTGSYNYNIGGHAGHSIGKFTIEEGGTYRFEAALSDSADTQQYLLALGKDVGKSTVLLVVGIIGMGTAIFVAFVIWLIVFILRWRAKEKLRASGYAT